MMLDSDRPDKSETAQQRLQANYTIEDKKNVINYYKKLKNNPEYKMKGYERDSIMRQYGKEV